MADGLVTAVVATSTARVEGLTLDSVISGLQPMAATSAVPTVSVSTVTDGLVAAVLMAATAAVGPPLIPGEIAVVTMTATAAAVAPTVTAASRISGLTEATATSASTAPTVTGGEAGDGLVTATLALAATTIPSPTLTSVNVIAVVTQTATTALPEALISSDQVVTGTTDAGATTEAPSATVTGETGGATVTVPAPAAATTACPTATLTAVAHRTVTVPAAATADTVFPEPEAGGAIGDNYVFVDLEAAALVSSALPAPTIVGQLNALVTPSVITSAADLVNPSTVVSVTPAALPAVAAMVTPTIHASVNLSPSVLHAVSRVYIPRLRPYSIDGHADDPNVRWVHLYQMVVPDPLGDPGETTTLRWTDDALPVYYGGNKFFSYVVSVAGVTTEHGQIASATLTVGNANNLFGNYVFFADLTGTVLDIWQGWLDPDRPTQLCESAWKIFHGRIVGISLSRSGTDSEARLTLGPYADPATKMFPPRTVASLIRG